MFVVPDEVPSTEEGKPVISGQCRADGPEADELPGAHPGLQTGHHQLQGAAAAAGGVRLLPSQRAARRAARDHARSSVHSGRRSHLLHAKTSWSTRRKRLLRAARLRSTAISVLPIMRVKLATRPDQRIGTDEEWDRAESDLETALQGDRARIWRDAARRRRLLRAQARVSPAGCDRPHLAVRDASARSADAAAARRNVRRRGRRASITR